MSDVVIATNQDDAEAAARVERHHAEMAGTLTALVQRTLTAARAGDAARARDALVAWSRDELLPHAAAEESTMYAAAHELDSARLLVESMVAEHRTVGALVDEIAAAADPLETAAAARALQALFETHLAKENELVLPALVSSPDHSVAGMLNGMHEILGAEDHVPGQQGAPEGGCGHGCSCGESTAAELPELDARAVPHTIRHATIFGALDAVRPGEGMVLVAPHDPVPLLVQLEERAPGRFDVSYVEQGPETWRLRFDRRS
jgi:uncharacterized protein (DUF2249 family)